MPDLPESVRTTLAPFVPMLQDLGLRLLAALAVFVIGRWIAGFLRRSIQSVVRRTQKDETLVGFVSNVAYAFLLTAVVLASLNQLGVQTTSLVAVLGTAGLAVGLALQNSLSNFGAGVLILLFRPIKVEEFVDVGGTMGTVLEISVFHTTLRSLDGKVVIVPNSKVIDASITNFTRAERRRVDLVFGVSYDDDLRRARELLAEVVAADERILKDPEPYVGITDLGDSSVNLAVWVWVLPADFLGVRSDMYEKGKAALEGAGLTIPFPQRDVHLRPVPDQPQAA